MVFSLKKQNINSFVRASYWFFVGFILSGAILFSAILFYFQHTYKNRVIPGIFIDNIYVGEMTKSQIEATFDDKNEKIRQNTFVFAALDQEATVSAEALGVGYDTNLISEQSLSLGKTKNLLSDIYLIASSYINGTFLNSSYTFDEEALITFLKPLDDATYKEPNNAQFDIANGRVVAFQESSNGQELDIQSLNQTLKNFIPNLIKSQDVKITRIKIPIKITEPETTTKEANDFGIAEVIGEGNSTFLNSIPNRVFNISLASTRTSGVIVAPGEEFSFAASIGDISRFTGYKEAYVISGGKTILGDGGGVCQVSTTLFRAILNAGLPITERNAHSYRVGYYEQDSPPGIDATIYIPSVDLKFLNDTENHILVQATVDPINMNMNFTLYGESDGRKVTITDPVITNRIAPPEPLYQDDPSLPAGTVKQTEYAAPGARTEFTRTVTRNGKVIISDTFVSTYRPWQAVYLRGTGGT